MRAPGPERQEVRNRDGEEVCLDGDLHSGMKEDSWGCLNHSVD